MWTVYPLGYLIAAESPAENPLSRTNVGDGLPRPTKSQHPDAVKETLG